MRKWFRFDVSLMVNDDVDEDKAEELLKLAIANGSNIFRHVTIHEVYEETD
jgi:hypothetical protein